MKNKIQILKNLFILPIVSLFIIACNSDGPEIEQPEKIYYDQAQKRMNEYLNCSSGFPWKYSYKEQKIDYKKYIEHELILKKPELHVMPCQKMFHNQYAAVGGPANFVFHTPRHTEG